MARPRTHDIDSLLDAAERLLADQGPSGVTIRGLARETGASSGSLYHAFGSRADLLGRMWLRAAKLYLALQDEAIRTELADDQGHESAVRATVAVASVPAAIQEKSPATATVLLRYPREEVVGPDLDLELRAELEALEGELLAVLGRLAAALWNRRDRASIETVAICVVDLPTAILLNRRERIIDPLAALEAAVRGVLAAGLEGSRLA